MSVLTLTQSATATTPNVQASFLAIGGTAPYTYSVAANGAGGAVNATTGVYLAPVAVSPNPSQLYDTIVVTDSSTPQQSTRARILVGTPLLMLCDIIRNQLGLSADRVYLWNQKIMQPTDDGLYIAVSVPTYKYFGNVNEQSANGLTQQQFVAVRALVDIDIISRGPAARDRTHEVVMALNSVYAQQQQDANSFSIGRIPTNVLNLSMVDGAAIPYRYKFSIGMQFAASKTQPMPYFNSNFTSSVVTDS